MRQKRFTIVEILVVMGIISFLAATLIIAVKNLQYWARIKRCESEISEIAAAVESYHADTGVYPPDYVSSDHDEDGVGGGPPGYIPEPRGRYYENAPRIPNEDPPPAWLVWEWNLDTGTESAAYSFRHITSWGPDGVPGGGDDVLNNTPNTDHAITQNAHTITDFGATAITNGTLEHYWSAECSCGWHNRSKDNIEQSHNFGECGKALYDFLCRPMKGRRDRNGNDWPGIEPYYEPDATSVVACGHDEGWGSVKTYDSNKLIDPWGRSLRYLTVCREYRRWNPPGWNGHGASGEVFNKSADPANPDFTDFRNDGWNPSNNEGTFDLWSAGPDRTERDGVRDPNCSWDPDNDNIMNWVH